PHRQIRAPNDEADAGIEVAVERSVAVREFGPEAVDVHSLLNVRNGDDPTLERGAYLGGDGLEKLGFTDEIRLVVECWAVSGDDDLEIEPRQGAQGFRVEDRGRTGKGYRIREDVAGQQDFLVRQIQHGCPDCITSDTHEVNLPPAVEQREAVAIRERRVCAVHLYRLLRVVGVQSHRL